mgnify:CR=1 FL=1
MSEKNNILYLCVCMALSDHKLDNYETAEIIKISKKLRVKFHVQDAAVKINKKFKNSDLKLFKVLEDKLHYIISKFNIGSHINTLKRGYAFVRDIKNKSFVSLVKNIKSNQDISITFYDGTIKATTKEKKNN